MDPGSYEDLAGRLHGLLTGLERWGPEYGRKGP